MSSTAVHQKDRNTARQIMLEPNALKSSCKEIRWKFGHTFRTGGYKVTLQKPRGKELPPASLTYETSVHPPHITHSDDTNHNVVHLDHGQQIVACASCSERAAASPRAVCLLLNHHHSRVINQSVGALRFLVYYLMGTYCGKIQFAQSENCAAVRCQVRALLTLVNSWLR
jgi:hypothetical protein